MTILTLILVFILGSIITTHLTIQISKQIRFFYSIILGVIIFTAINYLASLILGFYNGIIYGQILILLAEVTYFLIFKPKIHLRTFFAVFKEDKTLLLLLTLLTPIFLVLFYTHIIPSDNGNLYTGESTYGDLPFHLTTISQIAYGQKFPPENPFYHNLPQVYPFLVNFFSAILVYGGMSLRNSITIPGVILSLALIVIIYDFAYTLTRKRSISFLATILFLLHGGIGVYYFITDYNFNILAILNALSHPTSIKEYSHLFDQNIQWANFLSRMIVPERSILFGIPVGIIILRLLFFRNTKIPLTTFELVFCAILLSFMPLLHTHTVLAFAIILPILALASLSKQNWKSQIKKYFFLAFLTILFGFIHIPLFLNHLGESQSFFRLHLGWMKRPDETIFWFWFKNTYLLIPFILLGLFSNVKLINNHIRWLLICSVVLLITINLFLFSPYDWDNVKFLFWVELFAVLVESTILVFLYRKNLLIKSLIVFITITLCASGILSLWREIFVSYPIFSKDGVELSEYVKNNTTKNSLFLTYPTHNSPISNLAGRSILMGYPGSLWVHGINYSQRETDIKTMFIGNEKTEELLKNYKVDYVVIESHLPDFPINKEFYTKYPSVFTNNQYIIYKIKLEE